MGVVYEAHDPRIDRAVAIKTIALGGLDARETAVFEARFEAEMRFAGRLQHQNIAALYDTGREGDTAYIVMELVPGQDLRRLLAAGRRFEPAEAIGIVGQLLAALDYAHRRQVIHRDVKPANVMLQDDGLVKLCDFGVARPADDEATRTQGVMVGSLHYASPEQVTGLPIDTRTDLFSTGALLFELLTGERPFKGASEAEVLNRIAHAETPSCRSLAPQVPPEVDAAIQRAMAKRPADRFASAEAFALALGVPLPSAGGTGSTPLRLPPSGDRTAAAAAAPAGVSRRLIWIGGGVVAGAALIWAMFGRAPAGPADTPAAPLRVAGSASAPAPQASSGAVSAPVPPTAAPEVVAGAGSMPAPSGMRPQTPPAPTMAPVPMSAPAPAVASAGRSPSAPSPAAAPSASRPSWPSPPPASTERRADAASSPAAPRASSAPAVTPAPASRPAPGPWQARLACGPKRTTPLAQGSDALNTGFTIEVDGPRLSWRRDTPFLTMAVTGRFDEAGRFQAEGQGTRRDRGEALIERAEGSHVPSSGALVGRVWLLRARDQAVLRDCELTATPGAPPPVPVPAVADRSFPELPQGEWDGEMHCAAAAGPEAAGPSGRPLTTPATVTVDGKRLRITREGAAISESAEGAIDAGNRFTASGTGRAKLRRGTWTVQIEGEFLRQPVRLQGRVQLLRSDDGSLARECSLRASPRP